MKAFATLIMGMLLVAAVAGTVSGAEEEDTCAVLFDFGNGQVMWADVPVAEGMNAFNVTVDAATKLGLIITSINYGSGSSPNMFIDTVDGLGAKEDYSEFWGTWTWNSTINSWAMNNGLSSISAGSGMAFALRYAPLEDSPLANPDNRYPWTCCRYDYWSTGQQTDANLSNITLRWSKNLNNGPIDAPIIGANGQIYVMTGGVYGKTNSVLYCYNLAGEEIWNATIGAAGYQIATPLLYNAIIIVPSANGKLYSFFTSNGTAAWLPFDTGFSGTNGINTSPIKYLDRIILAAGNGTLYSINANDGTPYQAPVNTSKVYAPSLSIYNGIVFIGDEVGNISALDANSLGELWSTRVGEKVRSSPLVDVENNQVVITYTEASRGGIAGVNMSTGDILWQTTIGSSPSSVSVTSEGFVSLTLDGLVMVSHEGDTLWNLPLNMEYTGASPTVVGDKIFALTNEDSSRLVAVDLTGKLISETILTPANYAMCSPTFIDDFLFMASDNGYVYAFSTGSAPIPPADPEAFPWMLVGGLAAVIVIAAVGLVYWRGKKA